MTTTSTIEIQNILRDSAAEAITTKRTRIQKPGTNDVLCGRGGGSQNHIGNREYRAVINANKCAYIDACRKTKTLLVESIVKAVRMQSPPGRFLEKDTKSGLWNDIGDKRAFAKTCQAIREGAPKIRKEMQDRKVQEIKSARDKSSIVSGLDCIVSSNKGMTNISHTIDALEMPLSKRSRKVSCESLPSMTENWTESATSVKHLCDDERVKANTVLNRFLDDVCTMMHKIEPDMVSSATQESKDFHVISPIDGSHHNQEKIDLNKMMNAPIMEFCSESEGINHVQKSNCGACVDASKNGFDGYKENMIVDSDNSSFVNEGKGRDIFELDSFLEGVLVEFN